MNVLRPSASPPLLLVLLVAGCAARQETPAGAGDRDARRQEIALLDRQIAAQEVGLGLRPAAPPPGDAEAGAGADAEASPPPSMQGAPPGVDHATSPEPESPVTPSPAPLSPTTRFAEPPQGTPAEEGSCVRVCRSVAAICSAASRICHLADGLDDAWADDRCASATRSCASAEQRAQSRCAGSCG